jgi:hypothetical protein
MGSMHGERGLEVVETAHGGDTVIQRGVDYPFPTYNIFSQFLDRLVGHYQLLRVCIRRAMCTRKTSGNLNSIGGITMIHWRTGMTGMHLRRGYGSSVRWMTVIRLKKPMLSHAWTGGAVCHMLNFTVHHVLDHHCKSLPIFFLLLFSLMPAQLHMERML